MILVVVGLLLVAWLAACVLGAGLAVLIGVGWAARAVWRAVVGAPAPPTVGQVEKILAGLREPTWTVERHPNPLYTPGYYVSPTDPPSADKLREN